MPDGKLNAKSFPAAMEGSGAMADGKLFNNKSQYFTLL